MKLPRRLFNKILMPMCGLLAVGPLGTGCASSSGPVFSSEPGAQAAGATENIKTNEKPRSAQIGPFENDKGVRFQVGDLVIVNFSGTSEAIPAHEERIKEDGNITLPLIGSVKALGKSDGDLQTEIHDRYVPKYYVRLTVVVKYVTQELSYSVLGEVRSPGPKPYLGKTTVTKAIGAASGMTEFAKKSELVLTRANGTVIKVNYKKAIRDPKFDLPVFPGDSINVERTWY